MTMTMRPLVTAAAALLAVMAFAGSTWAADAQGGPMVLRRLTPDEYRATIANVFGDSIRVGGRFEPGVREGGLLAVGSSQVSITPTGFEQYEAMARTIAEQVVNTDNREVLVPCKPAAEDAPDNVCATQFIAKAGRLLYRRPLTADELKVRVDVAANAATMAKNFYEGLGISLADMLVSPQFLFRKQNAEPDPDHAGGYRLDAYAKASQLSFFLWDAAPDEELLNAAEKGELSSAKGLSKQVDRMLASRQVQAGARAFFIDMLNFDEFETLTKDTLIYPKYNVDVARDAQEQTLRTLTDLLVTRRGDYRDVFTSPRTFLTPVLGSIYGVPVPRTTPNSTADQWVPYEYPPNDPRAGLLAQASFVALHSHPGRSSPTLRGKALREILLCQKVPDPPANVNFTVVQDTSNPVYKTARQRLVAHRTDPACAGCHKLIDPMGLALENFDSSGSFRTTENGQTIDASGDMDGKTFANDLGLGQAVHDNPAAPACLVNRVAAYGLGRGLTKTEADWVKTLQKNFADQSYRYVDLLRQVATSEEFYRVSAPQMGALDGPPPQLASQTQQKDGVK